MAKKGESASPETIQRMKDTWARKKTERLAARAATIAAKKAEALAVNGKPPIATLQLPAPKPKLPMPAPAPTPTRTVIHHIADASNEIVNILRIPIDQLRVQLSDPISKTLVKREAINLSNRAEEFLSLIAHLERLEKIQKIRE